MKQITFQVFASEAESHSGFVFRNRISFRCFFLCQDLNQTESDPNVEMQIQIGRHRTESGDTDPNCENNVSGDADLNRKSRKTQT